MSIKAIIGGQWGDEGKGKIVDLLSQEAQIVARYQGGANAGHTVYKKDQKIVLHQIPTGALRTKCKCILGNGMVIDPIGILEEINLLKDNSIDIDGRILIDYYAHIVTPIHKLIDATTEEKTNNKIGTTCKGIGPTYVDKYQRIGIRAIDLLDIDSLKIKIDTRLNHAKNNNEIESSKIKIFNNQIDNFYDACYAIQKFIIDTFPILHENINSKVLIEGAQGTMLDIDHGTFPYVTSSNCSSAGIAVGLGLPTQNISSIIGIFKAYTTRVGGGPFPTELFDSDGQALGSIGKEFGATTGRPRRCGWFDMIAAKYSVMVNGLTEIALTKLDVLDSFNQINVCTAYQTKAGETENISGVLNDLSKVKPIYRSFEGWQCTINEVEKYSDLPKNAKIYIEFLEDYLNVPINIISVGPKRNQIIFKD